MYTWENGFEIESHSGYFCKTLLELFKDPGIGISTCDSISSHLHHEGDEDSACFTTKDSIPHVCLQATLHSVISRKPLI